MKFEEVKDARPVKAGEVIDRSEDGENYIIKLSDDKIYEVAPIAFYVWNMCDGKRTVGQIIDEISKEANMDPSQVAEPIIAVLEQLREASLISM